eukprot:TRINITY_DN43759_c0_g1_i1.p1 TRINITY_DN43759_c0_g1~~TRINITY_DN43759_c0_g1_i1.p1  ORF type:complete len:345 (+),score=66.81 TRINITY_DN43759_c0_g1_i1:27-1037(+)
MAEGKEQAVYDLLTSKNETIAAEHADELSTNSGGFNESRPLSRDLLDPSSGRPKILAQREIEEHGFEEGIRRHLELTIAGGFVALDDNHIGDDGAKIVRECIAGRTGVRRITLARCGLSSAGFDEVGRMLLECPAVEHLCLSGNKPEGCLPQGLLEGILHARSLRSVVLRGCGLCDSSLLSLSTTLLAKERETPSHITRLCLSENKLGATKGFAAVCELAQLSRSLETLELTDCSLGFKDAESLAAYVGRNLQSALCRLRVDRNPLQERGCKALLRLLSVDRRQFEFLDLQHTGVSKAECSSMAAMLAKPLSRCLEFSPSDEYSRGLKIMLSWREA